MNAGKIRAAVSAAVASAVLAGCGVGQFYGPPAPPPPRPSVPFGAGAPAAWPAAASYLSDHPVHVPKGMRAGVLVQSSSHSYVCMGWCRTWQGVAVISGGRTVSLSSDQGDNGMASLVAPGDLFEFPAGNLPVDAPGDDGSDAPAVLLARAVVPMP
jgi:hypothetical protein